MTTKAKKQIDNRIRVLIENGVKSNNRSFFVIVGDKGREQAINLHYLLSKVITGKRPSVLWCYKKDLGFTTNRQKRMKFIKQQIAKGLFNPDSDNPFDLFIAATDVRWTYYNQTHKILGNTFGMCVLQDFEAVTPNVFARTIETVEGGGIVILLLRTMTSLKQLYTLAMDVHTRYRTESSQDIFSRFNERFLLSLSYCKNCLIVDDELNILPISTFSKNIKPLPAKIMDEETPEDKELKTLKESLRDTEPVGCLINKAKTLDQGKALLTFIDVISEKTLRSTIALTAARGRGKSAALGLAISGAIAFGYANIFVTSPAPENLKTLFEFVVEGFKALEYKEHVDFELIKSTNPSFKDAIVRVNVFKTHRQTIQYIQPIDHQKLSQAELLIIDEAAAIPLPYVKALLGPYLVLMASTINGYEGTGRSLSLKLIQQLRASSGTTSGTSQTGGRVLKEIELKEPIRYAKGDKIEAWLNELLCLDATIKKSITSGCPHPPDCDLYYVNRDTLFSYHKASEEFLQRMMSLYVSSHYKNSPNDLMLMADAPQHHLFVLLGPITNEMTTLPEIFCVIQVCIEGALSRQAVQAGLGRGNRAAGDLIPWTISQQFLDDDFPSLSGVRIVRIASHPDFHRMGYGTRALEILHTYYEGRITNLDEFDTVTQPLPQRNNQTTSNPNPNSNIHNEVIRPRTDIPPLLSKLSQRPPEKINYLGVSYGITKRLFYFWKRNGFVPVYLRLTENELTGEHTCIMLKLLDPVYKLEFNLSKDWVKEYTFDFKRRYQMLLSYEFRKFKSSLALNILSTGEDDNSRIPELDLKSIGFILTMHDIKRLETYSKQLLDYHVIIDLLPKISQLFFNFKWDDMNLSTAQKVILIGLGLQHKTVDQLAIELKAQVNQVLAIFNKIIRKIVQHIRKLEESEEAEKFPKLEDVQKVSFQPLDVHLDEEMGEAEKVEEARLDFKQEELIKSLPQAFAVGGTDEDWNQNLKKRKIPNVISIKKVKRKFGEDENEIKEDKESEAPRRNKRRPKKQKK
eukprot:TRINITY_DN10705_c0_g1_i1.p1 TRINITY_DN10705_c0_g1~~TRINITY_DN10705_c0_g1_i1.p1  ORF type:complete len:1026 (+),score=207.41 TRINITY_DN10705_c0_g1_i1:72-3149(+)